jgi:hypothetical protein
MLAVKPNPAPVISATTDQLAHGSALAGSIAPSIPEAPAPQSSKSAQISAQAVELGPAAPAALPDASPTFATVKAQKANAAPTDGRANSVPPKTDARASDNARSTARGVEPTTNAGLAGFLRARPITMFLIFAFGLMLAGTLSRVVMKIAAARRARVIINQGESDSVVDQRLHEWRDDRGHAFVDERREEHSLISAASDYSPRLPFRADDERQDKEQTTFQITNEISEREERLAQLSQDLARLLRWPRAA